MLLSRLDAKLQVADVRAEFGAAIWAAVKCSVLCKHKSNCEGRIDNDENANVYEYNAREKRKSKTY